MGLSGSPCHTGWCIKLGICNQENWDLPITTMTTIYAEQGSKNDPINSIVFYGDIELELLIMGGMV